MKRLPFLVLLFFIFSAAINSHGQLWQQYLDSAKAYNEEKKGDKAIEYYNKAKIELMKDSMWTNTYARTCYNLANLYTSTNQYEIAEPLRIEIKQVWEKVFGKEHPLYALSCYNLGNLYLHLSNYEKAESFYLESKQIREEVLGKEDPDYIWSCNNLAVTYSYMGKYNKAESLFMEVRELRGKMLGKEHIDYASSCNNLAGLYCDMGEYQKAEPPSLEAREIIEKKLGKESRKYCITNDNLGVLYMYLGKYEIAESLIIETKNIRERVLGKDDPDYANSCNNLANLYNLLGQYDKAEPLYIEVKQIREKMFGKINPDYAASCNNLADLYRHKGQYNKSESLFIEAKQIAEKISGKENRIYASSCNNLGLLYMDLDNYKKAEPLFIESKQIWEIVTGKENSFYSGSCNNLADLYRLTGQYEKAEPLYLEAKNIRKSVFGIEHPDYTESCINLSMFNWNVNKPGIANIFFTDALQSQNIQLKKVFQFTSEAEQQSYLKTISDLEKRFLSFNTTVYSHSQQSTAYNLSLSSRNLILNSSQQLRNTVYNSSDSSVKKKYPAWINLREQISFWFTKPITDRPEYVKDLEEQANILEKELIVTSKAFKKERSNNEITWKNIQQSLKEDEIAIEFKEFNYFDGKRWTDSVYYIALVLRKDKPEPELVKLFEKKQLDSLLSYKKTSPGQERLNLLYSIPEKITNNSQDNSLYNIVWKPLEEKLKGISKIYYAPAGSLYKIAFAALPVTNKEVLSDKYQLVQLNTTATVADQSQAFVSATDNIILYGGVQYDADSGSIRKAALQYNHNDLATRSLPGDLLREGVGDFYFLKGSEQEVNQIEKLANQNKYSVVVSTGIMATEESFKNLSGKNSPVVLHIATHGFFFPDPKNEKKDDKVGGAIVFKQSDNPLFRSGLALSGANNAWKGKPVAGVEDGILTSYEVSNMYLPNTKLVVLSACETGLGDIQGSEGVYGLQRAFKIAGVQNLVMSLWRVDDIAASEFMQQFYKNLFAKQTINDAFYNAQAVMKNKYRNDPYKWATWVLVR